MATSHPHDGVPNTQILKNMVRRNADEPEAYHLGGRSRNILTPDTPERNIIDRRTPTDDTHAAALRQPHAHGQARHTVVDRAAPHGTHTQPTTVTALAGIQTALNGILQTIAAAAG